MSQVWSKIKTQYGSASQALSNLSLSNSEHDGDSEADTVIHNALVRFYTTKEGYVPQWLGVADDSQATQHPGRHHLNGLQSQQSNRPGSGPRTQSASLQEIYKRRQQQHLEQQQQNQQQQQNHPFRPPVSGPGRTQSYSNDIDPSGPPDRRDKFRNKLRSAGGSRANW